MNHLIVLYGQNLLIYKEYQLLLSNQAVEPIQVIQLPQPYDQFQIGRDYFFLISQKEISIQKCQYEQNLFRFTPILTKTQPTYFNLAEKAIIFTQNEQILFDTFSGQIEALKNKYLIATYQNQKFTGVTLNYQIPNLLNLTKQFDVFKQIYVIGDLVCICGYQSEEDINSDGDDVVYYKSLIKWYRGNKLINVKEVDQKPRTRCNGDFNFLTIKDVVVIYGSYLDKVTFWRNGHEIQKFVGQSEQMELNLNSQIRGACLIQMSPQMAIAIQEQFKVINRLPTIVTLQANQNIVQYEIIDIQQKIAAHIFQVEKKQQPEIKLLNQKDDLIMVQERDLQELEEEPTCIEVKIKKRLNNQEYKLPLGPGKIIGTPKAPLHHANLMINYFTITVIGFQNTLILVDHINLEKMLNNQNFSQKSHQIFKNQDEVVVNLQLFREQILCISNRSAYLIEFGPKGQISIEKVINTLSDFHEVQVHGSYILVQTFKNGITTQLLYHDFQLLKTYHYLAGCFYIRDEKLNLLFISENSFYIVSNINTDQTIKLDSKFRIEKGQHYYIQQLHKNKVYLGIAQIQDCELIQKIVQVELKEVLLYKDDIFESAIKDELQMATWNIQKFNLSTKNDQLNTLIFIFCSYAQTGVVVQIRNDEIVEVFERTFSEAYKIPSHMGILKGICQINFILPSEKFLNQIPGLLEIQKYDKKHTIRIFPSILVMVQDIQNQKLQLHRNLILNLNDLDSTEIAIGMKAITIRESYKTQQKRKVRKQKPTKKHQLDKYLEKALQQLDGRTLDKLSCQEGLYLSDELIERVNQQSIQYYKSITDILDQSYDQLQTEKQVLDKLMDFHDFYKLNGNKFQGFGQLDKKSEQLQLYCQYYSWFYNYIIQYCQQNSTQYHIAQAKQLNKNTYPTLGTLNAIANYFSCQIVQRKKRTIEFNQNSFLSIQANENARKKVKNYIKTLLISPQSPVIYYQYEESNNIHDTIREYLTDSNRKRINQVDKIMNQLEQAQNIKIFAIEEFKSYSQKFNTQQYDKQEQKFQALQQLRQSQQNQIKGIQKYLEKQFAQGGQSNQIIPQAQKESKQNQIQQQDNLLGQQRAQQTNQQQKNQMKPSQDQQQYQPELKKQLQSQQKVETQTNNKFIQNANANKDADLVKPPGQSIFGQNSNVSSGLSGLLGQPQQNQAPFQQGLGQQQNKGNTAQSLTTTAGIGTVIGTSIGVGNNTGSVTGILGNGTGIFGNGLGNGLGIVGNATGLPTSGTGLGSGTAISGSGTGSGTQIGAVAGSGLFATLVQPTSQQGQSSQQGQNSQSGQNSQQSGVGLGLGLGSGLLSTNNQGQSGLLGPLININNQKSDQPHQNQSQPKENERQLQNSNQIPQSQQGNNANQQDRSRQIEQPQKQENVQGTQQIEQQDRQQQRQPQQQKQNQLKLNLDKLNLGTATLDLASKQEEFQNADTPKANKQGAASKLNNQPELLAPPPTAQPPILQTASQQFAQPAQQQFVALAPPTAQPKLPDQLKRTQAGSNFQEESSPPPQPQLFNQMSTNQGAIINQGTIINQNPQPLLNNQNTQMPVQQNTLFSSGPLTGQFQSNQFQNLAPQGGLQSSTFQGLQQSSAFQGLQASNFQTPLAGIGQINQSQFGSTQFFAQGGQNPPQNNVSNIKLSFSTVQQPLQTQQPQQQSWLGFQSNPMNFNINANQALPRK